MDFHKPAVYGDPNAFPQLLTLRLNSPTAVRDSNIRVETREPDVVQKSRNRDVGSMVSPADVGLSGERACSRSANPADPGPRDKPHRYLRLIIR